MSTLTKPFTFTGGTFAVASQVNSNFDTIVNYINTNAVVVDGSRSFTAVPTGPNSDPSSANQLTRKSYVDGHVGGHILKMGLGNVTTDVAGNGGINFSPVFPSTCDGLLLTAQGAVWLNVASRSANNFFVNARSPNGSVYVGNLNFFYVAWGT